MRKASLERLDPRLELRRRRRAARRCARLSCSSRSSCSRCCVAVEAAGCVMLRDAACRRRMSAVSTCVALVARRAGSCCSRAAGRRRLAAGTGRRSRAGSGSRCPGRRCSHEPRLGRIGCMSPQFISSSAGSWFGTSACIERMTQQVVDAARAMSGRVSLTSIPLWPYLRELERRRHEAAPVLRSVLSRSPAAACRRTSPAPAWGRRCRRATARRS